MVLGQIKIPQNFLFLPRFSHFSQINTTCIIKSFCLVLISKRVDFDNFASVPLAFMEEKSFGGPFTSIPGDINHIKFFIVSIAGKVCTSN